MAAATSHKYFSNSFFLLLKLIDLFVLHLFRLANARINSQCFWRKTAVKEQNTHTQHHHQQQQQKLYIYVN